MLHRKLFLLLLFSTIVSLKSYSVTFHFDKKIRWNSIQQVEISDSFTISRLAFEGANYIGFEAVPFYSENFPLYSSDIKLTVGLSNIISRPANEEEVALLKKSEFADTTFKATASVVISRKQPYANVKIIPVRWNQRLNTYEKLVSFQIVLHTIDFAGQSAYQRQYAENSVLANGEWFKLRISESGIFKITYQELSNMGFDVGADPRKIAVFGNGGGILPEVNTDFRYDDLQENPILVVGESDGNFDPEDYILFYGEGPVVWKYNSSTEKFYHQNNYYDDFAYYFITVLTGGEGKRINEVTTPGDSYDTLIDEFSDYAFHEVDEYNLAGTGREWYGDIFDFNSTKQFDFNFPNIVSKQAGHLNADFATTSESPSQFKIYINDNLEDVLVMPTVPASNTYQIGQHKGTSFGFPLNSDQVRVKLVYERTNNTSAAYLNWIDLNVKRKLKMAGGQMIFRQPTQVGGTAKYELDGAGSDVTVWDITGVVNPQKVKTYQNSGRLDFYAPMDTLREFIAFNGTSYLTTEFVKKVDNQNLHSVKNINYLIITHPDFMDQATRLADYHRSKGMSVYVTVPEKIYNEFSSGSQDVTAIRDFAKMLYDKSDPGEEIKYLLLFGDASYDYKDQISDNTNYVPCWESLKSLNIVSSVASDDYFGFLDDGEGDPDDTSDRVDIGIGRFVVVDENEAKMAVDKTIHYDRNAKEVMGPWRTILTFVADDGDNNTHMTHAEYLTDSLQVHHKNYNIDKIYLDAYQQISTPSGQAAPAVNDAINHRIDQGTLLFNYSGHGGEIGLGHEKIVEIADINSWKNYNKLAVFITATCEFSRYDDPTRVSAGELVFLNPNGGAVALLSTARATFASSNLTLNANILQNNMFKKKEGKYPSFGDVIRQSKKSGGDNDKKFILIGDPALQLAYPDLGTKTLKINQHIVVDGEYDTIHALEKVSVEGTVLDEDGNKVDWFNGTIYPTVYDKYSEVVTLGDESTPRTFFVRKNILFNGKASIENGDFMFEFIVPKDIAYNFGQGRISYYLTNDSLDGAGYYEGIIIGGFDNEAVTDNNGPNIRLFMNDTTFKSGDITDQNPVLLALVSDESGINTTGNGIGHDIIASIDDDLSKTYSLNKYYEADRDSYNSGSVTYPFNNLSEGKHTVSFKIWDIYNNSSTAYLDFLVTTSDNLVIQNLMNYPNPFSDFTEGTNFVFDHNQSGKVLDVKVEVYNTVGALVKTLETSFNSETYKSTPIHWDGRTDGGGKIGRGLFVYRVIVKNPEGSTAYDQAKLVYIR